MGLLSVAVTPAPRSERMTARTRRLVLWLIVACYLLISIGLTWRLWSHPTATAPTNSIGVSPDIYLNTWFMRYAATAVAHGRLPALVTTAINYPNGVNAMWNTSLLLPSVLLAPVTLVAGPLASLTTLMTLGFAGSAAAMLFVLRRWGASIGAAAVGGALYAFSPAMMVAGEDHYHLQFAVLLPLIVDAMLRLATGRGHALRTGAWLGVLVAAQIFIAEEMLVIAALASLVVLILLAANRPKAVRGILRHAAAGTGAAVAVVLLLAGYALWVQFHGPLKEHGSPWHLARYGNIPADFVTAPYAVVFHGDFLNFISAHGQRLVEYFAYLGWPLLGLLAVVAVCFWRDLRVRVASLAFALLELLSIGGHRITIGGLHVPGVALPWHWLSKAPVLSQVVPNRISIVADGLAAVVIAFGIDRARAAVPRTPRWRRPAIAAVAGLAILPIIPRPVPAEAVIPPPPGWQSVISDLHLKTGAPVLVLPQDDALAMEWQAITNEPISIVGGYCITPAPDGHAAGCDSYRTRGPDQQAVMLRIDGLASGMPVSLGPRRQQLALALAGWRPAAVVALAGADSTLGHYLIGYFGPPTVHTSGLLGWRILHRYTSGQAALR